ncbi:MAG: glycoside hydrolase family 78 protein [Bacteroidales bacterium]|nr:glycoside hydrolase family 78 protein [Bacteroidales bacterium]
MNKIAIYLLFVIPLWISCNNNKIEITNITAHAFQCQHPGKMKFGWNIETPSFDFKQTKVKIEIASAPTLIRRGDIDILEKEVETTKPFLNLDLTGKIKPGLKYYYRIKITGDSGEKTNISSIHSFINGLSYPKDWTAKWISYDVKSSSSLPVFRKKFELHKKPDFMHMYVCAPGFYDVTINGLKLADNKLDPPQTNFDQYALYQTYELLPHQIKMGENIVEISLGKGWYAQDSVWSKGMKYGDPLLLFQMEIYEDKKRYSIVSDTSWRWTNGAILNNNVYAGTYSDSRLAKKLEDEEVDWYPAKLVRKHPITVYQQVMEPMREMKELDVKQVYEVDSGRYVLDFGQNFTGIVACTFNEKEGQRITLRYAEEIDESNRLDFTSTGVFATKVIQADNYICNGTGREQWKPEFVYHGFRYMEISGISSPPNKDDFKGLAMYNDIPVTGKFVCSDEQMNKIHELNRWTMKGNLVGVAVDCPHRERCGWTGDVHTIMSSLLYNFDAQRFLTKYMYDIRSSSVESKKNIFYGKHFKDRYLDVKPSGIPYMIAPGRRKCGVATPGWGSAVVQIPWQLFRTYGDTTILREFYPDMKRWVDFIHNRFPGGYVYEGLGDWCPPGGFTQIDCPIPLSSSAFHLHDLHLLSKIASVLGANEEKERYSKLKEANKIAFNERFYINDSVAFGSQTANVMVIDFNLVDEHKMEHTIKALVNKINNDEFITTGIFGLGRIFPVLCDYGYQQLAYELLTKKGYNSFEYMWKHYGATTMREVLPIDDYYDNPEKNDLKRSHNHLMNACIDAFFYQYLLGIRAFETPQAPHNLVLKPFFTDRLSSSEGSYKGIYGEIKSSWTSTKNAFLWDVSIPIGNDAVIYLPILKDKCDIRIDNKKVEAELMNDESGSWCRLEVPAGAYSFEVSYSGE